MTRWLARNGSLLLLYGCLGGLIALLHERTSGFARPQALLGLISLGLLASLLTADGRRRRAARARFAESALLAQMGEPDLSVPLRLRGALLISAVALLLVAAARPKGETAVTTLQGEGYDLLICVDVSNSMAARDMGGLARLDLAKQLLAAFIEEESGNRIGLVGFAGSAHVMCPFTLDTGTLVAFLDDLDYGSVAKQGTAIGTALRVAIERFDPDEPGGKAILLLSDGEDLGSDPLGAAKQARELGIAVHTIGLGTERGDIVPLRFDMWGDIQPKMYQGKEVVSRLDEATLKSVADLTGGRYFRAETAGRLTEVLATLATLETRSTGSRRMELREDIFAWYLTPALLLLALEPLVRLRARRRREVT